MKTLNEYQTAALRTAGDKRERSIAYLALGVAGEAGEVADYVKKVIGHGHDMDRQKLAKELGDVLWYVATLAEWIGFSLEEIATLNVNKLMARYPNGFEAARSQQREVGDE